MYLNTVCVDFDSYPLKLSVLERIKSLNMMGVLRHGDSDDPGLICSCMQVSRRTSHLLTYFFHLSSAVNSKGGF